VTPLQLRRKIANLEPVQPISIRFETAIAEREVRKKDRWYGAQKEHWLGWLKEYDGPGYYARQSWDVTAEAVYNRVVNPSMILWLGEAAGVREGIVKEASSAALRGSPTMAGQSGVIRCVIPWSLIEECL
jgi:hypothetical protein